MAPRDKWGSPYDPRNGGKIQRPQDQREAERRQHQLRGCGDPTCAMCNPETASRQGNSSMATPRSNAIPSAWSTINEAAMRNMIFSVYEDGVSGATSSAKPRDPPAFTKARKEVESWLIQAPDQAFGDIVGNDDALAQLRDAIEAPVLHKALYEAYGMKMPRGALLSGPPGCGKTMFARAAASEMKRLYGGELEFVSISGSELQSMYVGETEGRIKAIFTYAREYKAHKGHPLLVFMDEAEVLLPDRTGRVRRVAPWEESQVATFLAEMDGMQESGAFVLLATNRPEVIDQAVLRDGRCDFKITVKRPTRQAVEVILRKNLTSTLLGEADLETLIFAAMESLYDPHKVIIEAHNLMVTIRDKNAALTGTLKVEDVDVSHSAKHFLLEHIISGAMAASIPTRATRYAFMRDKAAGVARGVTAQDVVKAVNDLFAENRELDHSFALQEFQSEFLNELSQPKPGTLQ